MQYSGAAAELLDLPNNTIFPSWKPLPAAPILLHGHALNIGPVGVTGSNSANAIAAKADCILAVGTRLQDFTTGSWTAFDRDARIIAINVGRHDAANTWRRLWSVMPPVADYCRLPFSTFVASKSLDFKAGRERGHGTPMLM